MIYVYDITTLEYLGWTLDPKRIGVDATETAPPPPTEQTTSFWNGDGWEIRAKPGYIKERIKVYQRAIEASYQAVCDDLDYLSPERMVGVYIGSHDKQYDADARAMQKHMTDTSHATYRIMGEVISGTRQEPASTEEFLALLPTFVRPNIG